MLAYSFKICMDSLMSCQKKISHLLKAASHLTNDSREVRQGSLFLAVKGERFDAREIVDEVVEKGAAAIIYDAYSDGRDLSKTIKIPCIAVERLAEKQGDIAAEFYNYPSKELTIIGVTGTNGKTSTTQFIAQTLDYLGIPCAVVGTIGYGFLSELKKTQHTTPDAVELQRQLADMRDHGAKAVAIEVSSHALVQHRVAGVEFDVAVFTQLSRDHLDYHGTMEAYGQAKAQLFKTSGLKHAVINIDDDLGVKIYNAHKSDLNLMSYSLSGVQDKFLAGIAVQKIKPLTKGFNVKLSTPVGDGEFNTALMGRFNIDNLLATLGVLLVLEQSVNKALTALSHVNSVAGRMQALGGDEQTPLVVVDYSHTPDSLQKALAALHEHCHNELVCVFGCGGDRDAGKRPQMGAIAEKYSTSTIITNDNPRSESPEKIAVDIQAGMQRPTCAKVILDRAQAIQTAINAAKPGDVVLIAGKGHETTQIIGDRELHFSDVEQVQRWLKNL